MKTSLIYFLGIVILSIISNSCRLIGLCEDSNLSLQKTTSAKNYLRVNGFYYADTSNNNLLANYLYDNGIIIENIGIPLNELPNYQVKPNENKHLKACKGCWGIFSIEGNKIVIESWQSNFNGCVTTIREEGKILNDTTFVLKKINKQVLTYKFMASNSKPDSTNNFIK